MGFAEALTLGLIILKLLGYLSITWFTCFIPIFVTYAVAIVILLIALILRNVFTK